MEPLAVGFDAVRSLTQNGGRNEHEDGEQEIRHNFKGDTNDTPTHCACHQWTVRPATCETAVGLSRMTTVGMLPYTWGTTAILAPAGLIATRFAEKLHRRGSFTRFFKRFRSARGPTLASRIRRKSPKRRMYGPHSPKPDSDAVKPLAGDIGIGFG